MARRSWMSLVVLLPLVGCGAMEDSTSFQSLEPAAAPPPPADAADNGMVGGLAGGEVAEMEEMPAEPEVASRSRGAREKADKKKEAFSRDQDDLADAVAKPDEAQAEGEARTRSWFPEAFLWQPLVETGDDGVATLDVRVPDQLTTWRVLALAHDRRGQQAGTVHTFDSTLPLYVDPVVPGWLYAGDRLVLPVQAVNTTDAPVSATLEVSASGAMSGLGRASVQLSAGGSDVKTIPLAVTGAGSAMLTASLSSAAGGDRAERTVPVVPTGRPVSRTRGGTVASTRTLSLSGPADADPTTEELEVLVFPGPLSVLQAELERLGGGARPADGAYGFALATLVASMSERAGVEVDPKVLRRLRMIAWQRVVHEARAPSHGQATDLLLSLADPGEHELATQLKPRLIQTVEQGQRADGTWSRTSSSTLQQVLVQTAVAARALPEDNQGARLRAAGAIERYAREIDDGYTAAVILAAGLASGELETRLQELVIEGLTTSSTTGATTVTVPDVGNAWGARPARAEVLAWTWLALPDDHEARGDLLGELMSGWDARYGFGAGRADAVALTAIAEGLPGTTEPVDVRLQIDGREVATATLDPSQPRVPAVLDARPGSGEVTLTVTPEVPGLAFVATRRSWVPWSGDDTVPGVDVEVETDGLAVGLPGTLELALSAPSGRRLKVEQGLPAGCAVDEAAVAARVAELGLRLQVLTDRVVIETPAFRAGQVIELSLPVTPAFAGRFQTAPLTLSVDGGAEVPMPPITWTVRGVGGS